MKHLTFKKITTAMPFEISGEEKDALMRAAYYTLTRNFTKTVNRFVVFKDGENIV